ncbi:MAG: hypothetical protein JJT90_19080 [Ectothiorhodospiraceae bacterium]|nr:hypothetical protein [Ectothiorhodospiraceae bacterium]
MNRAAIIGQAPHGTTMGERRSNYLVLVNLSSLSEEDWLTALREAGQPWHHSAVASVQEAAALLETKPEAYLLVVYDAPEDEICKGIEMGQLPSQALANWKNPIEGLLDIYDLYYNRMTLAKSELVLRYPRHLMECLSNRSGINLGSIDFEGLRESSNQLNQNGFQQLFCRLLALNALQDESARNTVNRLEACSLPVEKASSFMGQLDDLCLGFKSMEFYNSSLGEDILSLRDDETDFDRICRENELLIESLHKAQEELEFFLLKDKQTQRNIDNEKNNTNKENEKLKREIERKNAKLHEFSNKNKNLASKLDAMRRSKSWRLTAPLRAMTRVLRGQA